ncbi:hypothetical protein SH661x_003283 [Planctomicrobium sp. SH661]|uniref:hypothetical protein n=1 Tax=Planctomicrobium sp. SH661 TaxID=3448124 RepID=UPI003F5CB6F1
MSTVESPQSGWSASAETVVEIFMEEFGVSLTYDAVGVEQVSIYLELARDMLLQAESSSAIDCLGAFLGEALIRTCGGEWSDASGWWGVQLTEGIVACPFVQVRQQLIAGEEQSIIRYFTCLQNLATQLDLSPSRRVQAENQILMEKLKMELALWAEIEHREAV